MQPGPLLGLRRLCPLAILIDHHFSVAVRRHGVYCNPPCADRACTRIFDRH
ncbi:hypothetical protein G5B35_15510 [Parapusillimonas sp. SGNA-6]|nr:hypothetical protein [Parapusillimonas sp. SGNA-6]